MHWVGKIQFFHFYSMIYLGIAGFFIKTIEKDFYKIVVTLANCQGMVSIDQQKLI
jgi:hypothetical protein